MKKDTVIYLTTSTISAIFLLMIPSLKWLFRGTFHRGDILECIILLLGLIVGAKLTFDLENMYWVLYMIPIIYRLLFVKIGERRTVLGILFMLLVIYIVSEELDEYAVGAGIRYLKFYAVFVSITVLYQFFDISFFVREIFDHSLSITDSAEVYRFYLSRGYYSGIFYEPHEAACYISIALGIVFIEMLLYNKSISRVFLLGFLSFTLFLTQKKGITVAAIIALLLILLIQYRKNRNWIRILLAAIIIPTVVVIIVRIILAADNTVVFYRLRQFLYEYINRSDSTSFGRLGLYRNAITLWKEHPLFGIGWKNFITIANQRFHYDRPHEVNNDYLQILCENGIVGFILCMIPIILTIKKTIQLERFREIEELNYEYQKMILFCLFIQVLILLYALVEVPFYDETFFSVYAFSCLILKYLINYKFSYLPYYINLQKC